jgi:hypothetical protein
MMTGSPQLLTGKHELNQFIQCGERNNDRGVG